MSGAGSFGGALMAFLRGVGDQGLAIASKPIVSALDNIIASPTPVTVAAQGAALAVALPALVPNVEGALIADLAVEAKVLLASVLPPQT